MKGGFGWREETDVAGARSLVGAIKYPGRARGTSPSLLNFRGPRLFQGCFAACVGFSEVRGIYVSNAANDGVAVMPSPKFAYGVGRLQEHVGEDAHEVPPLFDRGMFPGIALRATQRTGFCAWDDAPYGSTLALHDYDNACRTAINAKPTPAEQRAAYDQTGLQWYDLNMPLARMDQIEDCLDDNSRMPVLFAMRVDKRFLEHRSAEPIRDIDQTEIEGGHMMCGLAVTQQGHLLFDNWWDDWGFDDGLGVLHRDLVNSFLVRNVVALRAVPEIA